MTKKPVPKKKKTPQAKSKTVRRASKKATPSAGSKTTSKTTTKAGLKLNYANANGDKKKIAKKGWIRTVFAKIRSTRIYKWAFWSLCILIALPFLLTILYRVEAVHPISTLMLGRYVTLQSVERDWVELENIAPVLKNSVVMSEDGKFCSHNGVDWDALYTVIDDALEGEKTRGASTLTMQTVKNLFLWNSRSFIRKGLEIPLAVYANWVIPKHRMMEIYLNIAEWDEGVFGIEAASQHYFKRSAKKLSSKQAALLTVTLPNPKGRNSAKPTKSMRRVANIVAKRARKAGAYVKCLAPS